MLSGLKNAWKKGWLGWLLLAISGVGIVFGWFYPPLQGYASTAIAVVAGIMALRPEMRGFERPLWFVVIVFFAVMEISAISHEHKDQQGKFDLTAQGLRAAVDNSKKAVDTLDATIKANKVHFDQTMAKFKETKQSIGDLKRGQVETGKTISLLHQEKKKGAAWQSVTEEQTEHLREFAHNWEHGDLDTLAKDRWEVETAGRLSKEEREKELRDLDEKIDNLNGLSRALLRETLSSTRTLQAALTEQLTTITTEDQEMSRLIGQLQGRDQSKIGYWNCCDDFGRLADYLDALVLRVKATD